ncbi:MAG: SusD family protein [Mucilaginibacter sp.]|nr:SusD family protein [Mucilaginibacter sp.]
MKKFRLIYITAICTAFILSACNKQLELKPFEQIEQDQAILTARDLDITLTGAYNRMGLQDLYGGGIHLYADLLATQNVIRWQGTYQELTQIVGQTIPNDNFFITSLWLDAYQAINQTNYVLANIDKANASNKNDILGQAKFLRGLVYFDLVRLFGKSYNDGSPTTNLGVPIVLTPTKAVDASSQVARATVEQVYQQAISDLKDAETNLANPQPASAILARLYLQKGDFPNALAEANKVIQSGKYRLMDTYAEEFPIANQAHVDNTAEDIFALQVTTQQGTNYLNTFYASPDNAGRGDIIIKDPFIATFESGDERLALYNPDTDGILRVDKFDNQYGNVRVVRLAEMYLIRAEANVQLASSTGAAPISDLNLIRSRAGLTSLAVPITKTAFLDAIYTERRHELAFEGGFFLHDAKRLSQPVGALPSNSPKLVFPIPLREINANPKLIQNEGY